MLQKVKKFLVIVFSLAAFFLLFAQGPAQAFIPGNHTEVKTQIYEDFFHSNQSEIEGERPSLIVGSKSQDYEYDSGTDLGVNRTVRLSSRGPPEFQAALGYVYDLGGICFAPKNRFFTSKAEYTAPANGTGITYKVFRQDIDWDFKYKGKTNLERALKGNSPYVMKNGKAQQLHLHHSRQQGHGPLFELSYDTHIRTKTGKGRAAVHPYPGKPNPVDPVNRTLFNADKKQYWIERAQEAVNQ